MKKKTVSKKKMVKRKTVVDSLRKTKKLDQFQNIATGWGGSADNTANTVFSRPNWKVQEDLDALYDHNWLAKRAVDAPAEDMVTNWVEFIASSDDDISKIEESEKKIEKYDLLNKVLKAVKLSRLHWGSAIFLDFGDDHEEPLESPENKEILRIEVLDSWYCNPVTFYRKPVYDQSHPQFGEPEHYHCIIQHAGGQEVLNVHESRLVIFKGLMPSSSRNEIQRRGWGFSVLEAMHEALVQYGSGIQGAANVLQNFFFISLKIEQLAEMIAENKDDLIVKRAQQAVSILHSQNVAVYDKEEDLKRDSASVSGMDVIIDRLANQVCAASHPGIPFSVLFSAEGGALGGSSAATDKENYYKRIKSLQRVYLKPKLDKLFSMLGIELYYVFNAIDSPTKDQELARRKTIAEESQIYINTGVLLPEEVTKSRFSKDRIDIDSFIVDHDLRSQEIEENEDEDLEET